MHVVFINTVVWENLTLSQQNLNAQNIFTNQ